MVEATQDLAGEYLAAAQRGGLIEILIRSTELGIDLIGDPTAADTALKALRLARRKEDAQQLAIEVAQRNIENSGLVLSCFNVLHRCGAWAAALDLLGQARAVGSIKTTANVRIVEADCQSRQGRDRLARHTIKSVNPKGVNGAYLTIYERLLNLQLPEIHPDVSRIETLFEAGETAGAAQLFYSFLQSCRPETKPSAGLRDAEQLKYAELFASRNPDKADHQIVLAADSIALPRPSIGVNTEDTYPWLIKEKLEAHTSSRIAMSPFCRRGLTIRDVGGMIDGLPSGDVFILQIGIVDCAPRVFLEKDVAAVRSVHGEATAEAMITLGSTRRRDLQKARTEAVYVPLNEFGPLLNDLLATVAKSFKAVILVNIVGPGRSGRKMVGQPFSDNVADYNAVLLQAAESSGSTYIDLDGALWSSADAAKYFSGDNYHYNASGHRACADILFSSIIDALHGT